MYYVGHLPEKFINQNIQNQSKPKTTPKTKKRVPWRKHLGKKSRKTSLHFFGCFAFFELFWFFSALLLMNPCQLKIKRKQETQKKNKENLKHKCGEQHFSQDFRVFVLFLCFGFLQFLDFFFQDCSRWQLRSLKSKTSKIGFLLSFLRSAKSILYLKQRIKQEKCYLCIFLHSAFFNWFGIQNNFNFQQEFVAKHHGTMSGISCPF